MNEVLIRPFRADQAVELSELVKRSFLDFVSSDCSQEGTGFFLEWMEPEKIQERYGERFSLVAEFAGKMIGIIEFRDGSHLSLLFVDKEFHCKGIAKCLLSQGIKILGNLFPDSKILFVNASLYGVPFYKKFGFHEISTIREENGIRFVLMEKVL